MRIVTRKSCYYYIDTNLLFSTVTNKKVHYSQFFYVLFQNLSICSYYLCFFDILHGKEFNFKVISNTHFLVPPNITQYIKMLVHILKYMLFFRVLRTFKIKYLLLFICVLCTLSYELPFLILIYCVFYIYTCTIKVSAIIVFLLGLYYI